MKDRGDMGCIIMLVQRQVTPRWEDDSVRRYVGGGVVGAGGGRSSKNYLKISDRS